MHGGEGVRVSADDKGGEPGAADVAALHDLVRRVVVARVRDPDTADDLVQETLTRVTAASSRLDDVALAPYAVATARNLVSSLGREQARDLRHRHRLVELPHTEGLDHDVVRREEEEALAAAFSRLGPEERRALAAHEVQGVPLASLAEESRSTPGAVAVRMARARAKLRVEYLLALRRVDLPTDRCMPVLVALSSGDRRRQRTVGAGEHLLECPSCASLSEPLVKRSRTLTGLWPLLALGGVIKRLGRWARGHPVHAAGGATVAAVTVAALVLAQPDSGSLRAGDRSLLPPDPAELAAVSGQGVEGRSLTVEEVVTPTAFWVGNGQRDRVFVEVEGAPPFPIAVGQKVSFVGKVQAHHQDPAERFGLGGPDAAVLRQQGHHVDVEATALRRG